MRAALAGTATLVRLQLRRDRIKLPVWAVGLGLFVVYVVSALDVVLGTPEAVADVSSLYAGPLGRMVIGPGYGFDAPTHARFVANGYGLYLMALAAVMSILVVVRHTRAEEQAGRAELVRAGVVGRHATLAATLVVAVATNAAAAGAVGAAMIAVGGFGVEGSLLLAAAVGAVGLAFAGVTTITVQLAERARLAAGLAGAALGVAFVVRAGGDVAAAGGSALSWASPLGWGQQTAPFVLDRWWPLGLLLAGAATTTAVGFAASTRRDLDAGMISTRPGPGRARRSLGTPVGLAFRLGRNGILAWTAALLATGVVCGAFAPRVLDAADDLPAAFVDLFGADDLLAGYLAYLARLMALLAAAYAVLAVGSVRTEEVRGRADWVLAAATGRARWLGAHLAVTVAGVMLVMAVVGAGTGVAAGVATGRPGVIGEVVVAHLNQVPAVLVVLALALAAYGIVPRAVPVVWLVVGYAVVAGTFGPVLDLPPVALELSPFEHPAEAPLEPVAPGPLWALTLIAAGIAAGGVLAFRRRDVDGT